MIQFKIDEYEILYYDLAVREEIWALPETLVAKFIRYTEIMKQKGPDLGMPHTKAMGKGLFELRLSGKEGIGRIFYGTLIRRKIIMLHSFVKKTEQTPQRELDIAYKRLKEIKAW